MNKKIIIYLPEDVHLLDIAGPQELVLELIQRGYPYDLVFTAHRKEIYTSTNLRLDNFVDLDSIEVYATDILIVPGFLTESLSKFRYSANLQFYRWLNHFYKLGGVVIGFSLGVHLLGTAGILKRKFYTTHIEFMDLIQKDFPEGKLIRDQIIVKDGNLYTSSGAVAAIDLMLFLIDEFHNAKLAAELSTIVQLQIRRPHISSQRSYYVSENDVPEAIYLVQEFIQQNLKENPKVEVLAEIAGMSKRHLIRKFQKVTGLTLTQYKIMLRIEHAKTLLKSPNLSIKQISSECGYRSVAQFDKVWKQSMKISPRAYRKDIYSMD